MLILLYGELFYEEKRHSGWFSEPSEYFFTDRVKGTAHELVSPNSFLRTLYKKSEVYVELWGSCLPRLVALIYQQRFEMALK